MKFNNVENIGITTVKGDIVWKSRSVAVCAVIMTSDLKVIVTKRSDKVDHCGLWALPCGYIDWNESIHQALIREVWEELGINVDGAQAHLYHINDDPSKDEKQNITFHFVIILERSSEEIEKEIKLCDESTQFDFIDFHTALNKNFGDKQFAFNHDERLHKIALCDTIDNILNSKWLNLSEPSQFEY